MTIQDKIKAQAAKSGVIPESKQYDMLDNRFEAMCETKAKLDAIKKWAEAEIKRLNPEIEVMLIAEGVEAVRLPGGAIVKQGRGRSGDRIIAAKLVQLGVPVDTIAAATEEGKPYTFAQIVMPKGEGFAITTFEELEALAENYGYEAA